MSVMRVEKARDARLMLKAQTVCILNVEDGRPSLSNESMNNVNMALDVRERRGKRFYRSCITKMPIICTWAAA